MSGSVLETATRWFPECLLVDRARPVGWAAQQFPGVGWKGQSAAADPSGSARFIDFF
jgi:hypothetical protein